MDKRKMNGFIGALILSIFIAGCGENYSPSSTEEEPQAIASFNVNKYALNQVVCDPFGGQQPNVNYDRGLTAKLYYLNSNQPRYDRVQDYFDFGTRSLQFLFFSELNVPTRLFDEGFPTQTGGVVKTDEGVKLEEYFALRFASILKLGPEQEEGEYEVAMLSDDGSIMRIRNQQGDYVVYIDNDGDHPTRLGCGTQTLNMTRDSEHILNLDYYQGPRFHIALIPLWRRVVPGLEEETLCGATGNRKFFDYDNNSEPQQAYLDLLARGWEPIKAVNYHVPKTTANDSFNPCVSADPPVISDLSVFDDQDGGLWVSWSTNVPATSQVLYTNTSTEVETLTTSDNVLRSSHRIRIPKPGVGEAYEIKAVSVSNELGKAVSTAINFQN